MHALDNRDSRQSARQVTAVLLLTLTGYAIAAEPEHDGFATVAYCELRQNQQIYDRKPIRVRGIWRYRFREFSYIHGEPECGGRSDFRLVATCPAMRSLTVDLDGAFEVDVAALGTLSRDTRGLANVGDLSGDGSIFLTSCIEQAKEHALPKDHKR